MLAGAVLSAGPQTSDAGELRGVRIRLGDQVTSAVSWASDVDTFLFDGFAGARVSFTLRPEKESDLDSTLCLRGPSGNPVDLSDRIARNGTKLTIRRLELPETGRYALDIGGEAGSEGAYWLKTAGRHPRRRSTRGLFLPAGGTVEIPFPAMTDARVKVRIRARGGDFDVLSVQDPKGRDVPGQATLFTGRLGFARATIFPLGPFGEYRLIIGNPGAGVVLNVLVRTSFPKVGRRKLEVSSLEPVVLGVSPEVGRRGDGVSIHGGGFRFGELMVRFGEVPSTQVIFVSVAEVTARVPAGEGVVTVTVGNPDGQENGRAEAFEYLPPLPVVHSVDPAEGPDGGGTVVEVRGADLEHVTVAELGALALPTPPEVMDSGLLRIVTAAPAPGIVNLALRDRWGGRVFVDSAFEFVGAPVAESLFPPTGTKLGRTAVTVTGVNLRSDDRVLVGGIEATEVEQAPGGLRFETPAHAVGRVDVRLVDPWGRSTVLEDAFEFTEGRFADVTTSRMPENFTMVTGSLFMGADGMALGDLDGDADQDLLMWGVTFDYKYFGLEVELSITVLVDNEGRGDFTG